jgi:hypothetical protein
MPNYDRRKFRKLTSAVVSIALRERRNKKHATKAERKWQAAESGQQAQEGRRLALQAAGARELPQTSPFEVDFSPLLHPPSKFILCLTS